MDVAIIYEVIGKTMPKEDRKKSYPECDLSPHNFLFSRLARGSDLQYNTAQGS